MRTSIILASSAKVATDFRRFPNLGALVFCFIWVLWGTAMSPRFCSAADSELLPFPLPLSLEVGQSWTYSIVSVYWADWVPPEGQEGIGPDTLHTGILNITIEERFQIESEVYFALDAGGLYRVDGDGKTWKFDTETSTELLLWDIWGPPVDLNREVVYEQAVIQGSLLNVEQHLLYVTRWGPYERNEWDFLSPEFSNLTEEELIDWGVDELYKFEIHLPEHHTVLIFAPDLGVLYFEYLVGYGEFTRTKYVLQTYQQEILDDKVTGVENVSLGQIKANKHENLGTAKIQKK